MENSEGVQIIETTGLEVFEAQERAAIDTQIATAKRYPRDLMRVKNNSVAIVMMDKETAESCRYAKPVAGGNVSGPSVHLARIICQQYGNIRVQQRIKQITQREIVAEAVAFDLETNYAVSVEARRSIIGKNGMRYSDSLIDTNAMATLAIAERNAVLKVIPKSITDSVYKAAFNFVNGDLDNDQKLQAAKKKAFDYFKETYDANEVQVLGLIGLKNANQIKPDHIADLRAFIQALKDGDTTADELFKRNQAPAAMDETKPAAGKRVDPLQTVDPIKGNIPVNENFKLENPK